MEIKEQAANQKEADGQSILQAAGDMRIMADRQQKARCAPRMASGPAASESYDGSSACFSWKVQANGCAFAGFALQLDFGLMKQRPMLDDG